jgi:hypothetical protein
MIIGTNMVLRRLPLTGSCCLIDNSAGLYSRRRILREMLHIYDTGQLLATPDCIAEAQTVITDTPGWMEEYGLTEDMLETCMHELSEEVLHILNKMAPEGCTLFWEDNCLMCAVENEHV